MSDRYSSFVSLPDCFRDLEGGCDARATIRLNISPRRVSAPHGRKVNLETTFPLLFAPIKNLGGNFAVAGGIMIDGALSDAQRRVGVNQPRR